MAADVARYGPDIPTETELKATLKQEVQNNLVCRYAGKLPTPNAT